MSTSALCRAALLTAAPSSAPGSGVRRSPAAGRRAAPGAAGFRGVSGGFTLSTTMAPPPKPKVTTRAAIINAPLTARAAVLMGTGYNGLGHLRPPMMESRFSAMKRRCKADGQAFDGLYFDEPSEEVELVRQLELFRVKLGTPMPPEELTGLSRKETAVLSSLREVAIRGYMLVKQVANGLIPDPASPLFRALGQVGCDFLGLRSLVVHPVGLSLLIIATLDNLRKLVSSTCDIPLPLTSEFDQSIPGDTIEEEIVDVVKIFCRTVEEDVQAILSAKNSTEVNLQEFDKYYAALCKQTEEAMTGRFILLPLEVPFELSEEESALQNKLKEIAERCMDLQADAMRRLRPEQRRPLYLVFRTTHLALASVKVRAMEGQANSGVSSLLIFHKLYVVRKMVSSACSAPLPLDRNKQELSLLPPFVEEAIGGLGGVDSNSAEEMALAFIEYTYNTVKSDIDEMITASAS